MTYPYINNSHNVLVTNQFNPDSFQVVQQVYCSLGSLKAIYSNLLAINKVGNDINKVIEVESYLEDIHCIYTNMYSLLSLEKHIPYLKELEPKILHVLTGLENIEEKLNSQDVEFHNMIELLNEQKSYLDDFTHYCTDKLQTMFDGMMCEMKNKFHQYEQKTEELLEKNQQISLSIQSAVPIVKDALKWAKEYKADMAHLKASDAVLLAVFDCTTEAYDEAVKAIKYSKKFGNDERINEERLNYRSEATEVNELVRI